MPERCEPVETHRVDFDCPKCGTPMEATGLTIDTNPPIYEHACPKCGHGEVLDERYPLIRHRPPEPARA